MYPEPEPNKCVKSNVFTQIEKILTNRKMFRECIKQKRSGNITNIYGDQNKKATNFYLDFKEIK